MKKSRRRCQCCGQARGYIYAGPVYSRTDLEERLCPWCIADGKAHVMFEASFTDDSAFPSNLPRAIVEEVVWRTPGFSGWQQESWKVCCGDAATFLEPVGYVEISRRAPHLEESMMAYIARELELADTEATKFYQSLDRDYGPTAYLFRCLHCGRDLFYIDFP